MPASVLVVDDEPAIRRLLRNTLERAGYAVTEARNGQEALAAAASRPDVVLLDLGLPDRDGLGLIPLLRAGESGVLLVVSAREATEEKVAALDLGADDYVTKPFDTEELLARLRAALRHRGAGGPSQAVVTSGELVIDLAARTVHRKGEPVHLTRKEYDVLAILARQPGRVVTHEKIITAAWRGHEDTRVEYLRIIVRNLRQKLEAPAPVGSLILNELGVGYRLREQRLPG